jgi:DNA helicase-2/ATP-dependent DNA helicase PcrA
MVLARNLKDPSGRGRANLDAFRNVAANYARTVDHPNLVGFLGWLETAQERERGLDQLLSEVNAKAVQLITIHAAKGLEWDIVAVPGLVEENFPSGKKSSDGRFHRAWLTDNGKVPYPLRGDSADLPSIEFPKTDQAQVAERLKRLRADSGQHELASERRLAYVAFTRARHEMLLTGYWWGTQTTLREVSPFLQELVDGGLVADADWHPVPEAGESNPVLAETKTAIWPLKPSSGVEITRKAAAEVVSALAGLPLTDGSDIEQATSGPENQFKSGQQPSTLGFSAGEQIVAGLAQKAQHPETRRLAGLASVLLTEQLNHTQPDVAFPAQASASALVELAKNRDEFAAQLRRPIPRRPTVQAQLGTQFHEWVQQHFEGSSFLFDDDELLADQDIESLKTAFLESLWAARTPVAVEQEVHLNIAGVPIIARIDAVFADPTDPSGHVVVDWKTGSPGNSPTEQQAREVQLAVYRLAWAKLTGMPLEQVSAAFHYVKSNQTVRPDKLLSELELETLIKGD